MARMFYGGLGEQKANILSRMDIKQYGKQRGKYRKDPQDLRASLKICGSQSVEWKSPRNWKVFFGNVVGISYLRGKIFSRRERSDRVYALFAIWKKKRWNTHFFYLWVVRLVWLGLQVQIIPRRGEMTSFHQWLFRKFQLFKQDPTNQEFAFSSMCCVLRLIWKQSNKAYFEKKDPNPMATILQTNSLTAEILKANADLSGNHEGRGVRDRLHNLWRLPRIGVVVR